MRGIGIVHTAGIAIGCDKAEAVLLTQAILTQGEISAFLAVTVNHIPNVIIYLGIIKRIVTLVSGFPIIGRAGGACVTGIQQTVKGNINYRRLLFIIAADKAKATPYNSSKQSNSLVSA